MSVIFPDSVTVNDGSVVSGNIGDVQADDGTYLVLAEVNDTPGFDYDFPFLVVPNTPQWLHIIGFYDGNLAHTVKGQIFNEDGSAWEDLPGAVLPDAAGDAHFYFALPTDLTDYRDVSDNINIKILHTSAGNMNHELHIDYMALDDDVSFWFTDDLADSDVNNPDNYNSEEDGSGATPTGIVGATGLFSDTAANVNGTVSAALALKNLYFDTGETGGSDPWSNTFDLNDFNLTLTGDFVDSATSTILSGTDTLEVSGITFTIAGTWTDEGGKILFTTQGDVFLGITTGTESFNDVEFNVGNSVIPTIVSAVFDVDGDLTITEMQYLNGTKITLGGDLIVARTNSAGTGRAEIEFDGTNQEIYVDKASGSGVLPAGIIFNCSGTLTVYDTVKYMMHVSSKFQYLSGTLDFSTNTSITILHSNGNDVNLILTSGDITFYNLIIDCLSTGEFDINTNDVIVANTFTITECAILNGQALVLQGDVVLNDATVSGTATTSFTGGNVQTITGSGMKFPDGTVTVNKSGGSLTLGAPLNLDGAGQDFVIQLGTFDCDIHDLTVNDSIVMNGGEWQAGSSVIECGGDFTLNGVFTGGTSTIVLTGTSNITFGGQAINDININAGANTVTVQDTYSIGGELSFINGELDLNGQDGTIQDIASTAGTFTMGSGVVAISGDVNFSGLNIISAAVADINLDGGGTQSLNFDNSILGTITVTNSIGLVTFSAGFTLDEFTCIVAGVALAFQSGQTFTITNLFRICGTSVTDITIVSTTPTSSFDIDVQAAARECCYLSLTDAHQIDGTAVVVSFGVDVSNNSGWTFIEAYIWDGNGVGNLATTGGNWVGDSAPINANAIRFDTTSTKDCTWDLTGAFTNIDIISGYTGEITVTEDIDLTANFTQADGTVTFQNNKDFFVDGTIVVAPGIIFTLGTGANIEVGGNINFNAGATVTLSDASFDINGTVTQDINFGGNAVASLTVSNTIAAVTFSISTTIANWIIDPNAAVVFIAGGTFTVAAITWDGIADNLITLDSTIPGVAWNLNVGAPTPTAEHISVRDSDASSGNQINASTSGVDRTGNTNWLFPGVIPPQPTVGDFVGGAFIRTFDRATDRATVRT